MNDKPQTKWGWRLLRWGMIGLAVLVTLAAILVTEENWRGKHAWETYKRTAEARGEKFERAAFTPTNVPDDQNFFCAPIVAKALQAERNERADGSAPHATNSASRMNFGSTDAALFAGFKFIEIRFSGKGALLRIKLCCAEV